LLTAPTQSRETNKEAVKPLSLSLCLSLFSFPPPFFLEALELCLGMQQEKNKKDEMLNWTC
jgi:hypothetical protein